MLCGGRSGALANLLTSDGICRRLTSSLAWLIFASNLGWTAIATLATWLMILPRRCLAPACKPLPCCVGRHGNPLPVSPRHHSNHHQAVDGEGGDCPHQGSRFTCIRH